MKSMTDPLAQMRADQEAGLWDLRPEQLAPLLLIERTELVPASAEVLRNRLNSRLADRDQRRSRRAGSWPGCVSDRWLQQEIEYLERALGVKGSDQ